jgi:hypothetical protein
MRGRELGAQCVVGCVAQRSAVLCCVMRCRLGPREVRGTTDRQTDKKVGLDLDLDLPRDLGVWCGSAARACCMLNAGLGSVAAAKDPVCVCIIWHASRDRDGDLGRVSMFFWSTSR